MPPPPGGPLALTGPGSACTGDTSEYLTDVPVGCNCQWYINDALQPQTTSPLIVTWTTPGEFVVELFFQCANGQTYAAGSIATDVFGIPDPQPITGDTLVCEYTYHTYSTVTGPLDSCEWKVNGVIQPGYAPSVTYSFGGAGTYLFEVVAFNPCGASSPQVLEVTAQGTAPAQPSPIDGPEESCEGQTDLYTTTVGQGESCNWWIDGILQSTTSTTLEVTWSERGNHLIEVRAVSDCGTGNPTFKEVPVFYLPDVYLGPDTAIIQGHTLILDAGNPGSDFLWSTGDTTQTLEVTLTGTYFVAVSNFCGADNDTIDISVIITIKEESHLPGCFNLNIHNGIIEFSGLPENTTAIQVFTLYGTVVYNGKPEDSLELPDTGIYFIRAITPEGTCHKKIFIP